MSEHYGSKQERVLTESELNEPLDRLRADISQNINGYLIEVNIYATKSVVTIDGKEFDGTFSDAVKVCAAKEVNWNRMLEGWG